MCEVPVIFPDIVGHNEVVEPGTKIISAGNVHIYIENGDIQVCCSGNSLSLNVKSRSDEDEWLIKNAIQNH